MTNPTNRDLILKAKAVFADVFGRHDVGVIRVTKRAALEFLDTYEEFGYRVTERPDMDGVLISQEQ